ncbi:biliverdin-producing heme oxygenase [Croceicoccus sp. Ery15]|uniref:biliverdin-producing heme oxygenase n=1 Tax=Croceicoccus sp. Ery15 TaxID=1703338 RepID=UPI001E2F5BBC|nr:biliverdin-producing heme oxygenase [Croceicoccus sp. Ery15]
MNPALRPEPGHAPQGGRSASGARFAMREQTRRQHEATEAAFAGYDLSRADHYRAFLTAHAAALPGIELAATGRGWKGFAPRLPLLADDLAALGAWLPAPMVTAELSDAGVWGAQYVLEGSKLGGRLLAKSVPDDAPATYLTPADTMSADWQDFCAGFEEAASAATPEWLDEAGTAAIECFQLFRRAATAVAEDLR